MMMRSFERNRFASIFGLLSSHRLIRMFFYLLSFSASLMLFILVRPTSLLHLETLHFLNMTSPFHNKTLHLSNMTSSYPRNMTSSYPRNIGPSIAPQCSISNSSIDLLIEIKYNESAIVKEHVNSNSSITPQLWSRIKPAMTTQEKETLRIILRQFIKTCEIMNFTHFMISGTLLGSYRHHGLMPWDDDVDILMRFEQRNQTLSYFRNYSKGHDIRVETGNQNRVKMFHKYRSVSVRGWKYRWPTVDISFYYENSTYIWEKKVWEKKVFEYNIIPKSLIFPLHWRPFELLLINSPFDAFAVLRLLYKDPNCVTLSWLHRTERYPGKSLGFSCQIVSQFYPFVKRQPKNGCVQEDLALNGKVLYSLSVDEPIYAITKPYMLQLITEPDLKPSKFSSSPLKRLTGEIRQSRNQRKRERVTRPIAGKKPK